MTRPSDDEPYQHGSTVLPGVPLPASAHPHAPVEPEPPAPVPAPPAAPGAAPEPAAAPVPVLPPPAADAVAQDAPAPAGEAPAPPRGRHAAPAPEQPASGGRSRVALLAVLGLVLVLAAVAAFVWPGFLVQSDDDLTGGQGPSPLPTPSSTLSVTLATPATVDGLRRFTGAADKALAASVAKSSVDGLTDPVSAVYGTGTTAKAQVIAWEAVSPPPADTVTAAFTGYEGSTGAKVTAVREVETPGLGGHMECGLATLKKNRTLQCFWADDASVGSVTVLSVTDRAKATTTASAIRAAVEQTG